MGDRVPSLLDDPDPRHHLLSLLPPVLIGLAAGPAIPATTATKSAAHPDHPGRRAGVLRHHGVHPANRTAATRAARTTSPHRPGPRLATPRRDSQPIGMRATRLLSARS